MKRVFISKNSGEIGHDLRELERSAFFIDGHSFLHYSGIQEDERDNWTEDADIVFFSSPRSVIFYFSQHPHSKQTLIACTGKTTAKLLSEMGHPADFVGEKSGDMKTVGSEFRSWCKGQKVLFPLSDRSLKTVSSLFPDEEKIERVVYRTIIEGKPIKPADIYVFTSPSNVEGFFLDNTIPSGSLVIAWGTSTAGAIQSYSKSEIITLEEASQQSLAKILTQLN